MQETMEITALYVGDDAEVKALQRATRAHHPTVRIENHHKLGKRVDRRFPIDLGRRKGMDGGTRRRTAMLPGRCRLLTGVGQVFLKRFP